MNVQELLRAMTLEEKASLCSGRDMWHTKAVERLGIPSVMMADGPHGLRKQPEGGDMGVHRSLPATCFPTAAALAGSWDPALVSQVGEAIAEECLQGQVSVLLGPGINIKRSPLCGRNFEYYSEDPYLAGELGAAFIRGVQGRGVGTSLKHFAVNNQEELRMTIDAVVDERALREIYLAGFERAVRQEQPWTVMAAYNRVNGTYCSEHKELLTDILHGEWGYNGLVVTDWGACNDRVAGLLAGQALEMPGGGKDNDRAIVDAVRQGALDEAVLDAAVARVLELIQRSVANLQPEYRYDPDAHHAMARKAAVQSAVLLRNEGGVLPLQPGARVALLGELARQPRYQGSGSSLINPTRLENVHDSLRDRGLDFAYSPGYSTRTDTVDESLLTAALQAAREADVVVVCAGLTNLYESEGFDREHMCLPGNQDELIRLVAREHQRVVVLLFGGAPVEMPWADSVAAILNMYLPGQAGGSAAADLLLGTANPSGKQAETYPLRYEDCPAAAHFPGGPLTVEYRESIFVGYRYFDTARKAVLFPFGHGLSYTRFAYSDLHVMVDSLADPYRLLVRCTVTNTGAVAGAEVAQLYVRPVQPGTIKAEKELKGFAKVFLQPGEAATVEFPLDERSFAHYDLTFGWTVEEGPYDLLVGASSRDVRLAERVSLPGVRPEPAGDWRDQLAADGRPFDREFFAALYGRPLPVNESATVPFTRNSTLGDLRATFLGRMVYRAVMSRVAGTVGKEENEQAEVTRNMLRRMLPQQPLRSLAAFSGGALTLGMLDGLLLMLNGRRLRGAMQMLSAMRNR